MKNTKLFNKIPLSIEDESSDLLIQKPSRKSRQKASGLISLCNNALNKNKNKITISPDKIMSGTGVPSSNKKIEFKYKVKNIKNNEISTSSLGYDEVLFGHSSVVIPNSSTSNKQNIIAGRRQTLCASTLPSSIDANDSKQIFKCVFDSVHECPCPLHRKHYEDLIDL